MRDYAAIAQLVERDLAKVEVAGPSPVCRSAFWMTLRPKVSLWYEAQVAELVDAHVSGACVSRRAGSSPVLGTPHSSRMLLFVGEVAELVDAQL